MSNKIFRTEWVGTKTKWKKRLDVIPAGTTDLSSPAVVNLPHGCAKVKKLGREFDNFPFGIEACPYMEVDWDFNVIGDNAIYDDFYDAVLKPTLEMTNIGMSHDPFTTGTIYKFYYDFGADDDSSPLWRLIGEFIQRTGIEGDFDLIDNTGHVEVEHVVKCALDQTNLEYTKLQLSWADAGDIRIRDALYDVIYTRDFDGDSVNYGLGSLAKVDNHGKYWFAKLSVLWDYIEDNAEYVYRKMLRDTSRTLTLGKPKTIYFKQKYDDTGALGTALDFADLWVLAGISDNDEEVAGNAEFSDGLFQDNTSGSMYESSRYTNAWDLLVDLFRESITKGAIAPPDYPLQALQAFDKRIDVSLTKDILISRYLRTRNKADKPKIIIKGERLGRVESSLYEIYDDDLDTWDADIPGGRNEGSMNLSIVLSNHPVAGDHINEGKATPKRDQGGAHDYSRAGETNYYLHSSELATWFNFDYSGVTDHESALYYNYQPHVNGLYYFDTPSQLDDSETPMPIRVHDHCRTPISPTQNTDDLMGCGNPGFNPKDYNLADSMTAYLIPMQDDSCKPRHQAKALLEIFAEASTLEAAFDLQDVTEYPAGGGVGFPWWFGQDLRFVFDATAFNSRLNDLSSYWFLLSSEIDDEKEIATVKFIEGMA